MVVVIVVEFMQFTDVCNAQSIRFMYDWALEHFLYCIVPGDASVSVFRLFHAVPVLGLCGRGLDGAGG